MPQTRHQAEIKKKKQTQGRHRFWAGPAVTVRALQPEYTVQALNQVSTLLGAGKSRDRQWLQHS